MNKDKISILDIKTPEQMFHFLNNHPNYYNISEEELKKVDKNLLFSQKVWEKYHYFLIEMFEEDVIKYIPKEWWIKPHYIKGILWLNSELFNTYYEDIINNEEVLKYLIKWEKEEITSYLKYIKDKDFYKVKDIIFQLLEENKKLKEALNNLYEIKEYKSFDIDLLK